MKTSLSLNEAKRSYKNKRSDCVPDALNVTMDYSPFCSSVRRVIALHTHTRAHLPLRPDVGYYHYCHYHYCHYRVLAIDGFFTWHSIIDAARTKQGFSLVLYIAGKIQGF